MATIVNRVNANRLNPTTAALASALGWRNAIGDLAGAGANMWKASQGGLANIFQAGILADVQKALGEQALKNQAQLYANNLALGNNQLSTLSQLGNAGYQNQIDRINALMKGLNPLLSGIGSGQAFSGLGTGIANMMGGASGSLGAGGLLGFQPSNRYTAAPPSAGGLGSYSSGIGLAPQSSVNTPNSQMMPIARGTNGGRSAPTSLGNYEQAARARLSFDQLEANSQAAQGLQQLMSGIYGRNPNQADNPARLARLGAGASLMRRALNTGTGLLGSASGLMA